MTSALGMADQGYEVVTVEKEAVLGGFANRLIKTMPENPQQRNFWQLLEKYKNKIPAETYDYVFHIFSAAVIGENPQLFGFDFDNPLAQVEGHL